MNGNWQLFSTFGFFIVLLFVCGAYCLVVTRSMIRAIIGIELLIKAVTLLIILAGNMTGQVALAQSLVITIIIVEVVIAATAAGIALSVFRHTDSLDVRSLKNLKG
ncbi:MAG: NADH-quinone oxidoreductase subunit K [Candidatus Omnitrophica bacterium]|nr:NADH-quinone oxidoreductase subunit K [Candidatus Omnitrophota bacterium]MDD5436459.1 NADH-quinone oxidoreductase subunit K [Candidatus Omnitrophota bacterium]